jgi:hypothetical protein
MNSRKIPATATQPIVNSTLRKEGMPWEIDDGMGQPEPEERHRPERRFLSTPFV